MKSSFNRKKETVVNGLINQTVQYVNTLPKSYESLIKIEKYIDSVTDVVKTVGGSHYYNVYMEATNRIILNFAKDALMKYSDEIFLMENDVI